MNQVGQGLELQQRPCISIWNSATTSFTLMKAETIASRSIDLQISGVCVGLLRDAQADLHRSIGASLSAA